MKIGMVLEGGALRGLFTAGALDYLLEQNIQFDYIVGVSAGAGNMMNYISGQKGRTRRVICPGKENRYYGLGQLFKTGTFLNLEKNVVEFAKDTFPYDFEAHQNSPVEHEIVVVNCDTAQAEYIDGHMGSDDDVLTAVKASCSVPLISIPVTIGEHAYMDGSLVDSIPYRRAFEHGCDKVFIIMTKTGDVTPTDYNKYKLFIKMAYGRQYPKFAEALLNRADIYQEQRAEMERLTKEGKIYVLRPTMPCISKFETRDEKMDEFYEHGYHRMEEEFGELRSFLELDQA